MINCKVEFCQGGKGQVFRLTRTPEQINAHIIYLAPLFEQANQTRHMLTRSAISVYELGIESIIFDHYGSGDSQGELVDATLVGWQSDIVNQITAIKSASNQPIFVSSLLSSALLLNDEIISSLDGLLLVQPELNGKKFTRQLKRMAIAGEALSDAKSISSINSTELEVNEKPYLEISGYQIPQQLFDELSQINYKQLSSINVPCTYFDWLLPDVELAPSQVKLQQSIQSIFSQLKFMKINEHKYWQATELKVSADFIEQEVQTLRYWLEQSEGERQRCGKC